MAYFTSLNRIILATTAVGVLLMVAGGLWFLSNESDDYALHMSQEFKRANDLMSANDVKAAVATYDELLGEAREAVNRETLLLYKAFALFQQEDQQSGTEAVALLGDLVQRGSDPLIKSWAVALLLQFYYSSQSPDVLSTIRSLDVFSEMASLPDESFLESLAEYGDSVEPTALGKIHLAAPLARRLIYDNALTDDERTSLAGRIENLMVGSELLENDEVIFDSPFQHMMLAHYRGIVLTAAAKGGTDPALAEAQFQKAIALANSRPDSGPMRYLSVYSHFYYAALAAEALNNGEKVRNELSVLIFFLDDAQISEVFGSFVTAASQNRSSQNYKSLQNLATMDAEFATFLKQRYGVDFTEARES